MHMVEHQVHHQIGCKVNTNFRFSERKANKFYLLFRFHLFVTTFLTFQFLPSQQQLGIYIVVEFRGDV